MAFKFCILIMGVSGAGKTTIGQLLAERVGCEFIDSDDLHSSANILKMRSGIPLSDADRWPWLNRIVEVVQNRTHGQPVIVGCSALKKSHRQILSAISYNLVYLKGHPEIIKERLQKRTGHFMPSELLDSQFTDLEEPENALVVPVAWTPEEIVEQIFKKIIMGL